MFFLKEYLKEKGLLFHFGEINEDIDIVKANYILVKNYERDYAKD